MEHEVMQRRRILFSRIYHRTLSLYGFVVPRPLRWALEVLILLAACAVLGLWGYVHFTYILYPGDCLEHIYPRPFPYDVILQVEVYENSTSLWKQRELAMSELYESLSSDFSMDVTLGTGSGSLDEEESSPDERRSQRPKRRRSWSHRLLETFQELYLDPFRPNAGGNLKLGDSLGGGPRDEDRHETVESESDEQFSGDAEKKAEGANDVDYGGEERDPGGTVEKWSPGETGEKWSPGETGEKWSETEQEGKSWQTKYTPSFMESPSSFAARHYTLYELFNSYSLRLLTFEYTILEFSQESGYLSLSPAARSRLNISVVKVYIDPHNTTCFGGPFGQVLSQYLLGYDIMIISSFKNLLPSGHSTGYVKNLLSGSQYYYRVQWMGKWRYGAGLLPAMFFTLVASVLLRQIHYSIFKFLAHFNNLINQGVPMPVQTGAQIPFLVITYAAIGLIIVMSEALSDDSVFSLFMVATVWEADHFCALYCQREASKRFFPWFFYLYHFIPYAYYIRFNGQFWFIPFLFHWLLLQHAMLFFLHHYELASFQQNRMRREGIVVEVVLRQPPAPDQPVLQPQPQEWAAAGDRMGGAQEEMRFQEGVPGTELRQRHVRGDFQDNPGEIDMNINRLRHDETLRNPYRRQGYGAEGLDVYADRTDGAFSDDESERSGTVSSSSVVTSTEEVSGNSESPIVVGTATYSRAALGSGSGGQDEMSTGSRVDVEDAVVGPNPQLLGGAEPLVTHLSPEQLRAHRNQFFAKQESHS